MLGDGKTAYDQAHDGDNTSIGACSANYRRTNVATKLKMTYIKDTYLNVQVMYKAWDEWTDCFTVEGLSLPNAPYLGFSAMTGDVSDNHDIISVSTYSAILSSPNAQRDRIGGGAAKQAKTPLVPGWMWTLLKIACGLGAVAGLLYAYKTWVLSQAAGKPFGSMFVGRGPGLGSGMFADSKRF